MWGQWQLCGTLETTSVSEAKENRLSVKRETQEEFRDSTQRKSNATNECFDTGKWEKNYLRVYWNSYSCLVYYVC